MLGEKFGHFCLNRLRQQGTRSIAQHLGERVSKRPWLKQLDHGSIGHGVSLLCWSSGGSNTPTIRRLLPVRPSPTSAYTSSGGEMMESLEDVGASLVADRQSTEAAEPGQSAFDDPAMSSQTLAALDAAPGDAIADPSPAQGTRAARQVIGLIGVELVRALAGPSPTLADRRHSIDQLVKDAAVMNVCRSDPESEGDTLGVGDNVALGPGAATIGRKRSAAPVL